MTLRDYSSYDCDEASAIEAAKMGKRHWGRWVFDEPSQTLQCVIVGASGQLQDFYSLELRLLRTTNARIPGAGGRTWLDQLAEKRWMGAKGLLDFQRAIYDLNNER